METSEVKDQAHLADPTDDRPPGPDAEPKRESDQLCTMSCGHRMNGRNLAVCIDGTSNQFGKENTNVIELYSLISKEIGDNQRTWYNSGIGTYARPSWKSLGFYKRVLYHKIDLAIAWDFERTVLGAYRWLSDNYEQGDTIFLFGFSRGAFQVRVLSAMIDKVGLVYKGNEMQIPFAYELYADPESDEPTVAEVGSSANQSISMAARFKDTFSNKDVKVHFVGAWGTVSSIGIARGKCMLPRTIDGMKHVCYFRHALALDERRVKFLPEYAYGGSTKPAKSAEKTEGTLVLDKGPLSNPLPTEGKGAVNYPQVGTGSKGILPHTKEVWFAGTHSDIGGGNVQNAALDRSRPPLRWMVFEAGAAGLRTARFKRELPPNEQINIIESLTWPWLFFEIFPFKRLTFTRKENAQQQTTRKPHLGSGRKIHQGQKIHSSLLRADDATVREYTPKARPVDDDVSFWRQVRYKRINANANASEWLELDLYEHSRNLVENLIAGDDDTTLQSLYHTAISGDARQAVYEMVIEALGRKELSPDVKHRLLHSSMQVLKKSSQDGPDFNLSSSAQVRALLSDLLNGDNEDYRKIAKDFVVLFTCPCRVFRMPDEVLSVAFSPDGKSIVSGSADEKVRIWDVETGKPVGEPLRGHRSWVTSVAFSSDGTRIASGSMDLTVWIWDAETGEPVGEPLQGHSGWVNCVTFSYDGTHLASASSGDRMIRIWDVETGKLVGEPLHGHSDWVRFVAFSPDGARIVSCSGDRTVRIWDAKTGKPVGEPLQGHSDGVGSVAFSFDGMRIVSGSDDGTIHIWDVGNGKLVGQILQEHGGRVNSVAFSPRGTQLVSGSDGGTIRIWDAETGKLVGEPLQGHRGSIIFVAFSSDSKSMVSGSHDGKVWIWELEELYSSIRRGQGNQRTS